VDTHLSRFFLPSHLLLFHGFVGSLSTHTSPSPEQATSRSSCAAGPEGINNIRGVSGELCHRRREAGCTGVVAGFGLAAAMLMQSRLYHYHR
jgi:hypothetical protein